MQFFFSVKMYLFLIILLRLGMNLFTGREQEIIQYTKEKFLLVSFVTCTQTILSSYHPRYENKDS